MYKKIYILFILTAAYVFAQFSGENSCNLTFPANINSNAAFDISLIASNPFTNADKLILYFKTSPRINFRSLELRTYNKFLNIPCRITNLADEQGNLYRAEIDLIKNKIVSKDYFQLLFNMKAENSVSADFEFSGIFKTGNETLGYIQSSPNSDPEDTLKLSSFQLKFYKPQRFADNSVQFVPGSQINIVLNNYELKKLLTEFWIKISNKKTDFLKIINNQSGEVLYDISINSFQMLNIQSKDQFKQEPVNPYFLSRGSWYHFSILTSFEDNNLRIYCGKTLIGNYTIPSFMRPGNLQWNFTNDSQNATFQLDLLRFIDFNTDFKRSYVNRNYLNFIGDSSRVLYQFNFEDEDELYAPKESIDIKYNGIRFTKSDAPIFARAPELNINLLGNIYELTWSGGDYKQTKTYALEKSVNNSDYRQISEVQADNDIEKEYSLVDTKDPSAEVIYYRIKQINIDGSIVYSSQVKIGQGMTEPFIVEQNYPNPFNPRTSIVVDLLEDSEVEITIYNLEGKEISRLFKGFLTKGNHKFSFDASELPSGVYLYKVSTPDFSNTKKMILTK